MLWGVFGTFLHFYSFLYEYERILQVTYHVRRGRRIPSPAATVGPAARAGHSTVAVVLEQSRTDRLHHVRNLSVELGEHLGQLRLRRHGMCLTVHLLHSESTGSFLVTVSPNNDKKKEVAADRDVLRSQQRVSEYPHTLARSTFIDENSEILGRFAL